MSSRAIAIDDVLDERLSEKLQGEAQQVRRHLEKLAEPASERPYFADANELRTISQVFQRAVDRGVLLTSVAAAIDVGAGKKTIASALLKLLEQQQADRSATHQKDETNNSQSILAHSFFQDYAKKQSVVKRMQAGDRFALFLHHLGYESDEIDVYRAQLPVGEGARNAFDQWLAAGHSLQEFCGVLDQMREVVLKNKLGL